MDGTSPHGKMLTFFSKEQSLPCLPSIPWQQEDHHSSRRNQPSSRFTHLRNLPWVPVQDSNTPQER